MNKELRWKLAGMILDKSREISKLVGDGEPQIEFAIHIYFKKLGFQRVYDGYEIEQAVPWQATPGQDGPHLLFTYNPDENHLYFATTTPILTRNVMVMKVDRETAEKILVMGMP